MNPLTVRHGNGEYDVLIGTELLGDKHLLRRFHDAPVLIVTDTNVGPLWLDRVRPLLPGAATLTLSAGEQHKDLAHAALIWDRLAELQAGRDVVLVALGGGVVGDTTGFAAACWMRGVRYVQIPTTLLAHVDSSIGGKTAIDHPSGKNLIGAFHQPELVVIDIDTLSTLPDREFAAGLAEIIKAALIADADFLDWLEAHAERLRSRAPDALMTAIRRSCEIKAAIVAADEKEHGERAVLNLGHTFGHAVETALAYHGILHGEAVAIGLLLAARLSENVCGLAPALHARLKSLLGTLGLPVRLPEDLDSETLFAAMRLDKKHRASGWRLIVLDCPGHAFVRTFDDPQPILDVLNEALRNG